MVTNDIFSVFLNLDEFAEMVDIDGRQMAAVLDENLTDNPDEGNMARRKDVFTEGFFRSGLRLFVSLTDMGRIPTAREIMWVNSKLYSVLSAKEYMGMLEIALEVNDA